jgi:hypothetical protein
VPVETSVLQQLKIVMCKAIYLDKIKHEAKNGHSDDYMKGMQARHKKVEAEKQGITISQLIQVF